jgi:hypothetical protein
MTQLKFDKKGNLTKFSFVRPIALEFKKNYPGDLFFSPGTPIKN